MWNPTFWKSVRVVNNLSKGVAPPLFSRVRLLGPKTLLSIQDLNCTCSPSRHFQTTGIQRLKTLFSEPEQSKILNFVNKLKPVELKWTGTLRPLNRIAETLTEKGPLNDVNDLLEKYSFTTKSAVNLCKSILKSSGEPQDLMNIQAVRAEKKKLLEVRKNVPRKMSYLWKTVKPEIKNPQHISSFTCVIGSENFIAYAKLEKQNDWNSQLLTDWRVEDISGLSQKTQVILNLANVLPRSEHYVVAIHGSMGSLNHLKLQGMVLALLCAKNDFREDFPEKIFEMSSRSAARYFNMIVGNEMVSSLNMVSDCISQRKVSETDDHMYRRSLSETTFEDHAIEKYNASDDVTKESLSQCLLVAKAFSEVLKVEQV